MSFNENKDKHQSKNEDDEDAKEDGIFCNYINWIEIQPVEVIEYEYPDIPPPLDIPKYCTNCDIPDAIYKCSACKQVYYCSQACQKQHWKQHKQFCGKESSINISYINC